MPADGRSAAVLEFEDAGLRFGGRHLWSGLSLRVEPGEFVAVLGANGSGKTSLLRTVLGLQRLSSGRVLVAGRSPRRGGSDIGYVPQQRSIDPLTPLRAHDLVGHGLDGHRWGLRRSAGRAARIARALESVDADAYAQMPVGLLSGGEQQRIRIAQALVADPPLLLCDEPLLSLDLRSQRTITALVDQRRRREGTGVLFVTHEINPVLPYVDRVLYLADGRFRAGPVEEVFTSATLSDLYGVPIEVVHTNGRIVVAGLPDAGDSHRHHSGATAGAEHV